MRRSTDELEAILDDLFRGPLVDAVVADGWPRAMVEAGFAMHRATWNPAEIAATIAAELRDSARDLTTLPRSLAHLWPALPGAGVTPVLYGFLAGVERQLVKPSSRGGHFAQYFADVWQRHDDSIQLDRDWPSAEHVVVSGTDEAVAAVEAQVGPGRVTSYGHRVSFAIIEADGEESRWVDPLATDIVMWHQQGCFSPRSVLLAGADPRAFGEALGEAIGRAEVRLEARLGDAQLSHRMQRRGAAEFETTVFGSGLGWVELRERFDGGLVSPHTVSLVPLVGDALPITLQPRHIQGVALGVPPERHEHWAAIAAQAGATRVCLPGELQGPPASWPHDGRPNILGWLGDN